MSLSLSLPIIIIINFIAVTTDSVQCKLGLIRL